MTGLGRGLSAAVRPWRAPRAVHEPGKIVVDLAAALALGGDCLADIAVLRAQPELIGVIGFSGAKSEPETRMCWPIKPWDV